MLKNGLHAYYSCKNEKSRHEENPFRAFTDNLLRGDVFGKNTVSVGPKRKGRRVVGVFPAQYPREILWAFDIAPVEIWDPPSMSSSAAERLQPYICSIVRAGLSLMLEKEAGFVDAYLFPHTCDSVQNLSSLIHDYLGPAQPCYFFYHPKAPYSAASRSYYARRLKSLARDLEVQFGPLDMEKLQWSVEMGKRISREIEKLYDAMARNLLPVTAVAFYTTLRKGEYLFADDFLAELERLSALISDTPKPGKYATVALSGILPNPLEIVGALESYDIRVGADDFLALSRRYVHWKPEVESDDPYEALTQSYFSLPPCSSKGSGVAERLEYLTRIIEDSRARGIIFWMIKYCEPELFDVPFISQELKKRGLKVLVLETEVNEGLTGQLQTRLGAFAELL